MSDGMSDARDYGPSLSKHGAPLISDHGKPLVMSVEDLGLVRNLIQLSRSLAEDYARRTGVPLADLRALAAADAVDAILKRNP
jgi:hypothetical protein